MKSNLEIFKFRVITEFLLGMSKQYPLKTNMPKI